VLRHQEAQRCEQEAELQQRLLKAESEGLLAVQEAQRLISENQVT